MNVPWLTILSAAADPRVGGALVGAACTRASACAAQAGRARLLAGHAASSAIALAHRLRHRAAATSSPRTYDWIKLFGAHYALGLDGIGLALVLLTAILTPVVMLASWHDGDLGTWGAKGVLRLDARARGARRSASSPRPTCSCSTSSSRRR